MVTRLKVAVLAALALGLSACVPWWNPPATVSGLTVTWPEAFEFDDDEEIAFYLVEVAGRLSAVTGTQCTLTGLASGTDYSVRVTAMDTAGEYSGDINPALAVLGSRDVTVTTPAGGLGESTPRCTANVDSDGDGLPDLVETDTSVFVGIQDTGTSPNSPDTDGDSIPDGHEVLGVNGLDLPAMGTNPLRVDVLVEFDWMDDDQSQMVNEPWYDEFGRDGCGQHSHRPTVSVINSIRIAFAFAPTTNANGSTGINFIADYGQGGVFTGGNRVADADGFINGGIGGPEFLAHKAANFAGNRNGYFHYVLMPHRYGGGASSGIAEVPGDDAIVSLYCFNGDSNVSKTIMHELGHNFGLRHGGNNDVNFRPNYNSVMNYRYQFAGVAADCIGSPAGSSNFGDGVLDYSRNELAALDESALSETVGLCDGVDVDWNVNGRIDGGTVASDLNFSGSLSVLRDHDDWGSLVFVGIGDANGAPVLQTEVIADPPVPPGFEN